jgi:segregation and condensation protein B
MSVRTATEELDETPEEAGADEEIERGPINEELVKILEALLFLSPDPVTIEALATATATDPDEVGDALHALSAQLEDDNRGLVVRELGGGWVMSTHPDAEDAARALFAKPRTPPLTPAQAETLAIVAYLQPVSRPEIARIRGVNAESAAQALLERGIIEESGRSQFGAVLYRTSDLFLKLFGLQSVDQLPDITEFDPSPELEEELRERLLRAGEARAGGGPAPSGNGAAPSGDGQAPAHDDD